METKKCGGSVKKSRFVRSLADGGFLDFLSMEDRNLYENMTQDKTPEEMAGIQGMFKKKQLGNFAEAAATSQGSGIDDAIASGVMTLGAPGQIAGSAYKIGKKIFTGISEKRKAKEEKAKETQRENITRFLAKRESEAFKKGGDVHDRPGGSNVGKKRKTSGPHEGPFVGPSGGAPKGSYPVTNPGQWHAALSYARHAPNPAGIKAAANAIAKRRGWKKAYQGGLVTDIAKQEGGIIKGKGTGTSDSIKAKLKEGDFIVPYTTPYPEVADALIKALGIKHNAPLKDGYIDVSVSDGEIIIPANRIDEANKMLSRKGMTLDELAPKAKSKEKELSKGGTITYKGKEFIWNPKKKRYVGEKFAFDKTGRKWGVGPDEGSGWEDMTKEELAAVYAQNRPGLLKTAGKHVDEIAGTAQIIDALLKFGKLEERPDRVIAKELAEVARETTRRAEYGLEPGIKSKAERDIERQRRSALALATSGAAGSGGTTLAAQIAAGIGTQESMAALAGIDQTAKERKERLADVAKLDIGRRKDVIREGEIERYDKMEDVLSEELLAGIGNIVGAQRYKQFLDQKAERDKLYSGLMNL